MKAQPVRYERATYSYVACDVEQATHLRLLMYGHFREQVIPIRKGDVRPSWLWNGDTEKPTLDPSILTSCGGHRCHCFIREGVIEYLPDSTHEYAGKNMPLRDIVNDVTNSSTDPDLFD